MRPRNRRRRGRSQLMTGMTAPLSLTHDEVLAELDPGWVVWAGQTMASNRSSRAS